LSWLTLITNAMLLPSARALPSCVTQVMKMKKLCVLVIFAATLLFNQKAMTEQLRVVENLRDQQINVPASIPDRNRMKIIDDLMFVDEDGTAAIFIFYDDVRTERHVDLTECYDLGGNLLLVTWIDRLGIRQVAMDRGLLDADTPRVDGTLVMVGVGQEL
jgi:hypothetical protein